MKTPMTNPKKIKRYIRENGENPYMRINRKRQARKIEKELRKAMKKD